MLALLYASLSGRSPHLLLLIRCQKTVGKESAGIGQGKALKAGWITKEKDTLKAKVSVGYSVATSPLIAVSQVDSITDTSREQLQTIQSTRTYPDPKVLSDLKKRKLVKMQKIITYKISKGPKFAREFVKEETDLTADMLAKYVIPEELGIIAMLTRRTVGPGNPSSSSHTISKLWAPLL